MEEWTQADIQQLCDDAEKEFGIGLDNSSITVPDDFKPSGDTRAPLFHNKVDLGLVQLTKALLLAMAEWLLSHSFTWSILKGIITALFASLVFISDSQRCVYYHAVKLSAQLLKNNQPFTFNDMKKAVRKDPCLHDDPNIHIPCSFHQDEKCKIRDKDIQAVLDALTKKEVFIKDETASHVTYKLRK
jgi:hypothetical protein